MRQYIKKLEEQQIHLHFIDFKAAFDTDWREVLWFMMKKCDIHSRITSKLEILYRNTEHVVAMPGAMTEMVKIKIGVRQGCVMSPTLFNIFLDFVLKEIHSLSPMFKLYDHLTIEMRNSDETSLISTCFDRFQMVSNELKDTCSKWGLKINPLKCKVLSNREDIS